ncbi:MAG: hypothetical protein ACQESW_09775 [Bacteroidota bacterium]
MKPLKLSLIVSFLLTLTSTTFGQKNNDTFTLNAQYLYDEFQNGTIESKQGNQLEATLNYNVVKETVHFVKGGNILSISEPETIDKIRFASKVFIPVKNHFYELIEDGTLSILLRREPDLNELKKTTGAYGMDVVTGTAQNLDTYTEGSTSGSYIHHINNPQEDDKEIPVTKQYYLMYKGQAEPATVGRIRKLLDLSKKEVRTIIKEQKIDLDNKSDLIRLTNQLQNSYL